MREGRTLSFNKIMVSGIPETGFQPRQWRRRHGTINISLSSKRKSYGIPSSTRAYFHLKRDYQDSLTPINANSPRSFRSSVEALPSKEFPNPVLHGAQLGIVLMPPRNLEKM